MIQTSHLSLLLSMRSLSYITIWAYVEVHQAIRLDAFSQNLFVLKLYNNLGYARVGEVDWRKGRFYLLEKLITTESEKR